MIIDTHSHYNLSPLVEKWSDHWRCAQEAGVIGSIVVGTSLETSQKAVDLAEKVKGFSAAVGIHPNSPHLSGTLTETKSHIGTQLEELKTLVSHKHIIAIGEIGLDYFRISDVQESDAIKELQKWLLSEQIEVAIAHKLPVLIHLRDSGEDAYWDFLSVLKSRSALPEQFVLHCVSGPIDFIHQCLELGAHIGVAGNVTYKNADHLHSIIKAAPREKILLETDAPYLPPTPHRGKVCEPAMIQLTAQFLEEQFGLKQDILLENTCRLFPNFRPLL